MRNHALNNVGYDRILRGPADVSAARAVILSTLFSLSLATSHTARADDVNHSCSTGSIQIPGIADVNLNALVVNTPGRREHRVRQTSPACTACNPGYRADIKL